MIGKIKKVSVILFVALFVSTLTASAVSADIDDHWCGNEPRWPHGSIIDIVSIDKEILIESALSIVNEMPIGNAPEIALRR